MCCILIQYKYTLLLNLHKIPTLIVKYLRISGLLFILGALLTSCSVQSYLKKDEQLVNKYRIKINDPQKEIDVSEFRTFFKPRPNKKFLLMRLKLLTYYRYKTKPNKLNKWLDKHFGEAPVLYDENNIEHIVYKMRRYMGNIGYFKSAITYEVTFRKKLAKIKFSVEPAIPYHISKLTYEIPDTLLKSFVDKKLGERKIKQGDVYNAYTFDDERDRITQDLRNEGYYYFNRNYIQYIVDTNYHSHSMKVLVKINKIKVPDTKIPGAFTEKAHDRYFINSVSINPNYDPINPVDYDTIVHQIEFWNDSSIYEYQYLVNERTRINPNAFNTAIKMRPGRAYSAAEVKKTYQRLFKYTILRTATISFDSIPAGAPDAGHKLLNARIQLQQSKLNSFGAELEGTNSSGDLGIRGNLVYLNKNIFKRAEVLRIRTVGGFEAQTISTSIDSTNVSPTLFNTFEAGIDGSLFLPHFVFPVGLKKFKQRFNPSTNITFGFNYQRRPYYSRNITNLNLGYTWDQNQKIKHVLTPVNINYVNVNPSEAFAKELENETNRRLKEQYSDHMIAGLNYSFIFNNQNLVALERFDYLRINLESSGNLLNAINTLSQAKETEEGYYEFIGVRYAQYVRINIDYRQYYYFFNKTNSMVFRLLLGTGIPYFNSEEIPYEKGFYAGGANDMRGWEFRKLGPGSFSGVSSYERVGDIQLELNAEYRFPIISFLKGALFADVGNIWTYNESETFPGGMFTFDNFYNELAVDGGIGLRFDFQYFVFRFDMAIPLRDPTYLSGERWRFQNLQFKQVVGNIGIGYPF